MKKVKKEKREVTKVRVKPKSNDISDFKHNHYTTSSMPIEWQSDLFIRIASCHETECWTDSTIAPADHCRQNIGSKIETTNKKNIFCNTESRSQYET